MLVLYFLFSFLLFVVVGEEEKVKKKKEIIFESCLNCELRGGREEGSEKAKNRQPSEKHRPIQLIVLDTPT
jgi:hypothetical protein